ncbi:hypothetical protein GOP47_0002725, partial [Adiantum capillus-veneris]
RCEYEIWPVKLTAVVPFSSTDATVDRNLPLPGLYQERSLPLPGFYQQRKFTNLDDPNGNDFEQGALDEFVRTEQEDCLTQLCTAQLLLTPAGDSPDWLLEYDTGG